MSHFPLPLPLQSIHPLVLRKWDRGGQSVASPLGGSKEIQRLFPGAWNPCEESITTTTSPVHPPVALPPSTSSRASDTQWNRKNSSPSRERETQLEKKQHQAPPLWRGVQEPPPLSALARPPTETEGNRGVRVSLDSSSHWSVRLLPSVLLESSVDAFVRRETLCSAGVLRHSSSWPPEAPRGHKVLKAKQAN